MLEIKSKNNASRAVDRDLMTSVLMRFITDATWLHLSGRSAIQWLRPNSNDSHLMYFIRTVDRGFNEDRTVKLKSP